MPQRALISTLNVDEEQLRNGGLRQQVALLGRLGQAGYHRMLVQLSGSCVSGDTPSPDLIRALGVVYDTLSDIEPRTVLVPLTRCAGWTDGAGAIVQLSSGAPAVAGIISGTSQGQAAAMPPLGDEPMVHHIVLPPIDEQPPGTEPITLPAIIPALAPEAFPPHQGRPPVTPQQQQQQQQEVGELLFDHVAVGGTFDRLHCGHELLLASTALLASKTVYVGITADKLLLNKNHRELLQPYEQRRDAAVQFMRAVRPGLHVEAGPLSDPQEPTQAELDPCMQAIVVSQETLPGALKVNQGRLARGFAAMLILVVPVIGCKDSGNKLSSTQLRARDAGTAASASAGSATVMHSCSQ